MNSINKLINIFCFSLAPVCLFAYSWPMFVAADKNLLLALGTIDTHACPSGQAKIVQNSSINIHDYLCRTFCPKNWDWYASSDNRCHPLETEFEYQRDEISYFYDNNNLVNYSIIKIYYGNKHSANHIFELTFKSELGEHWYCIKTNTNIIHYECANDIY